VVRESTARKQIFCPHVETEPRGAKSSEAERQHGQENGLIIDHPIKMTEGEIVMNRENNQFQAVKQFETVFPESLAAELAQFQERGSEHRRGIPWSWMAFRGPFEGFR